MVYQSVSTASKSALIKDIYAVNSTWTKYYGILRAIDRLNLSLVLSALENIEIQTRSWLIGNVDCARKCKLRVEKTFAMTFVSRLCRVKGKVFSELSSYFSALLSF